MIQRQYTIILHPEPEEGGYSVTVPALPGCFTQGETVEECVDRAKEAIALHIEGMIADGEPIPQEQHPVILTVEVAA
ncbi:MAG TPA: type II toxin-antitoxin system HicB family antitoxin [Chloroflexota bacterium]|nr:type II toxin-antitoxin system HicB family antitoxin [Chloroflexota bacterium]